MDPRIICTPTRAPLSLPNLQATGNLPNVSRSSSAPLQVPSQHVPEVSLGNALPTVITHSHLHPAHSAALGTPQIVCDLFYNPSDSSQASVATGSLAPPVDNTFHLPPLGGFILGYENFFSLPDMSVKNAAPLNLLDFQNPYLSSLSGISAQPFATPLLPSMSESLQAHASVPYFQPPTIVASPSPPSTEVNQLPHPITNGICDKTNGSKGPQRSPLTVAEARLGSGSVSPVKSGRASVSRAPFPVTPQQYRMSRSLRGSSAPLVPSPLSIETSPASTAYVPSPPRTPGSPSSPPRMWGKSYSRGDGTAAHSFPSSPIRELPPQVIRLPPPKTLKCPHAGCDLMFARPHDLRRHANIHTGLLPFTCLSCDTGFKRSDARQRHWKQNPECKGHHMSLEERGFDGGGKRRRAIKKTKGRSRVADLEGDSTGRRASTLDQPAAGENELGIPNQTISGPSTLWTSRGSPTPLTSASVPSNAAFALPFPTYFTTSTASPSTAFELLASNDDESF